MVEHPEALAQLARLVGDSSLPTADIDSIYASVEEGLERMALGLLEEAAASDDVIDSESAYDFLSRRLDFLKPFLTDEQCARLQQKLRSKIEAW